MEANSYVVINPFLKVDGVSEQDWFEVFRAVSFMFIRASSQIPFVTFCENEWISNNARFKVDYKKAKIRGERELLAVGGSFCPENSFMTAYRSPDGHLYNGSNSKFYGLTSDGRWICGALFIDTSKSWPVVSAVNIHQCDIHYLLVLQKLNPIWILSFLHSSLTSLRIEQETKVKFLMDLEGTLDFVVHIARAQKKTKKEV